MNFARPEALFLLFGVPALGLFFLLAAAAGRKAVARFGDPALLFRGGAAVAPVRRAFKAILALLAFGLLVVALAGPRWGATREKIERKGVDVVVVIDTSQSMLAVDVLPSRLIRAKQAIEKLIDLMRGDRIGIVIFSGSAFTFCPLTLDYGAARMFVDLIDTTLVPDPGTDIPDALRQAAQNFNPNSDKHKVVILISDGENLESEGEDDPVKAAEELKKQGVVIYTVGVGDTRGASIPIETQGGVIDKTSVNGEIVITKLDENMLRKIALAGGGKYRRLDNQATGRELADIYAGIAKLEKTTFEEEYQVHYEERFQWFVGAALLLLALEVIIPERQRKKA